MSPILENSYSEKKTYGQFFTSNRITQYIISKMDLDEDSSVADISCGEGAFLLSCFDYLNEKQIPTKKIISNIYGIDIRKKQLEITKKNLLKKSNKKYDNIINNNIIVNDTISTNTKTILKKFPEIAENGGFDVIVGNPPYVTINSTKKIKDDEIFSLLVFGQVNAATLMIGRAFSLLKEGGKLGLLLPKSILRVKSYKKLRDFLLSKFCIEELIDVGIEFNDVRGEQFILIATKQTQNPKNIQLGYFLKNKKLETYSIPFKKIINSDNFVLLENKKMYDLVDKIISKHPTLEQICSGNIFRGINVGANSKFVSLNPHPDYFKGLRGDSIKRFHYDYLLFIQKREYAKLNKIMNKKIVLQNIFSSESGIIANYDNKGLVTLDTVTNVYLENEDPYYVLGILNSSLIRFFMVFVVYNQSRLTMHADRSYIGRIPIPETTQKIKKSIIAEVKKQMNGSTSLSKLNQLIFDVYGLNDSERRQIIEQLEKFKQMGKTNWEKK